MAQPVGLNAYHDALFESRMRALDRSMATVKATRDAVGVAAERTAKLLKLDKVTKGPATRIAQARLEKLRGIYDDLGNELSAGIVDGVQKTGRDTAGTYQGASDRIIGANQADVSLSFAGIPSDTVDLFIQRTTAAGQGLIISPERWALGQAQQIELKVAAAIAGGQSARDLAKDLEAHLLGGKGAGVGGSVRSKTMTLARTEINVAYWESSALSAAQSNIVAGQRWNLSASHPKWDPCDMLAWQNGYNLGPGIYPAGTLPPRPHPNCFCWLEDVLRDAEDWGTPRPDPPQSFSMNIDHRGLPERIRGKIGGTKSWVPSQLAQYVEGRPISERLHLTTNFTKGAGDLAISLHTGGRDKAPAFFRALGKATAIGNNPVVPPTPAPTPPPAPVPKPAPKPKPPPAPKLPRKPAPKPAPKPKPTPVPKPPPAPTPKPVPTPKPARKPPTAPPAPASGLRTGEELIAGAADRTPQKMHLARGDDVFWRSSSSATDIEYAHWRRLDKSAVKERGYADNVWAKTGRTTQTNMSKPAPKPTATALKNVENMDRLVTEQIDDMVARYPVLDGVRFESITYERGNAGMIGTNGLTQSRVGPADRRGGMWFSMDSMGKNIDNAATKGGWSASSGAGGTGKMNVTVRHEVAHNIEGIYYHHLRRNAGGGTTGQAAVTQATNRRDQLAKKYAKKVTRYADSEPEEFVAETLAIYTDRAYKSGTLARELEEWSQDMLYSELIP